MGQEAYCNCHDHMRSPLAPRPGVASGFPLVGPVQSEATAGNAWAGVAAEERLVAALARS